MGEQVYGIRRDGSYYTRVEWASISEAEPKFWANNLIDDDLCRGGGTYGAHTMGPADVVLGFFGEEQTVSRMRVYRNVGVDISIIEELCKTIRVYVSDTDAPASLRSFEQRADEVPWQFVGSFETEKAEGWQEFVFGESVRAKYVRIELVENHGTPPEIDWVELNEVKLYP